LFKNLFTIPSALNLEKKQAAALIFRETTVLGYEVVVKK
jgi:hypothetical protein